MSDQEENEEELTLAEAAKESGYTIPTLLRAIQRGSLSGQEGIMIIHMPVWLVKHKDLLEYIARMKAKGRGPGVR